MNHLGLPSKFGQLRLLNLSMMDVKRQAVLSSYRLVVAVAHDGYDAHVTCLVPKVSRKFVNGIRRFLEGEVVVIKGLQPIVGINFQH